MAAPAADASKSSKRRKAKSTDPATDASSHVSDPVPSAPAANGTDTPTESPYVKELTK
jgi:hypothetical protein